MALSNVLTTNAAGEFLSTGNGDSLGIFEARLKDIVAKASNNDQKAALLDEVAHHIEALPEKDGRRQVILDFIETQRRILQGELP